MRNIGWGGMPVELYCGGFCQFGTDRYDVENKQRDIRIKIMKKGEKI